MITKKIFTVLIFVTGIFHIQLYSQVQVSGFVRDKETKEVLIGANVFSPESLKGTSTDNNGYFNLILSAKTDTLRVTYVGHITYSLPINFKNDSVVNIFIRGMSKIDEVAVYKTRIRQQGINVSTLSREELINIPSMGGEPDIMKTLQLLPGILTQNEGSSNLLVRGGGPGQNLFLLDNIPLFYVNHLGGFISVFNPEIINDVSVYKGGFPAKYGGKLSSVIDITLREGNKSEFKGSAGIGLTGANLTLEGPIGENASYIFTGRKTFTEVLMGAVGTIAQQKNIFSYGFYDINAKISWNPNPKDQFQFSTYSGDDQLIAFTYGNNYQDYKHTNKWGNIMGAFTWKHIYSPKIYNTSSLSFTRYRVRDHSKLSILQSDSTKSVSKKTSLSSVRDISFKSGWKYRLLPGYALDFGLQSSYLHFVPNKSWETKEEKREDVSDINALESSIYLENQISIGRIADLNLGIRGVSYFTNNYSHFNLEPRVEFALNLPFNQSLQFTYMNLNQYSHMVFAAGSFINNEVWVPTMDKLSPSKSNQYTFGWKGSFRDNMFEVELNAYVKEMSDLIEFKEGYANLIGDANWFSKIETGGVGDSKGIEFFMRKKKGDWSGFLSYSYAHTTRQFDNINMGKEYLYEYDRPHSISLDFNRKINDRISINAAWVYQTGLPYTPVIGRMIMPYTSSMYTYYDYGTLVYGERNSERMRDYHRLDIAMNYKKETKNGRDGTWTFSIYNAYNRHNAFFNFYNTSDDVNYSRYIYDDFNAIKQYQYSFFPFIPSLSYKVAF